MTPRFAPKGPGPVIEVKGEAWDEASFDALLDGWKMRKNACQEQMKFLSFRHGAKVLPSSG